MKIVLILNLYSYLSLMKRIGDFSIFIEI